MSTSLNARHRRHVERARKQGRADGPATIAKMSAVAAAARTHQHDTTCIVVGAQGRRWCTEIERYL